MVKLGYNKCYNSCCLTAILLLLVVFNLALLLSFTGTYSPFGLHDKRMQVTGIQFSQPIQTQTEESSRLAGTHLTGSIQRDMEKCSQALNLTEDTFAADRYIQNVAQNVSVFLNAIWSVIPKTFTKHYRNPCGYKNISLSQQARSIIFIGIKKESQQQIPNAKATSLAKEIFQTNAEKLVCMPYFFIAGFPKSGTTTLDAALRQLPGIAGPSRKEPHWWTRAPLGELHRDYLKLVVVRYLITFISPKREIAANPKMITYDGSQSTLWDSSFFAENHQDYCAMPVLISRVLPNAKFLVIMRNPVSRLQSMYLYHCTSKFGENILFWPKEYLKYPAGYFHKKVQEGIKGFNECRQSKSLYECVNEYRFVERGCLGLGSKMAVGIYYIHVLKWLQFYPKEQFLFLRMEDMYKAPQEFMAKLTNFLGLDSVSEEQARKMLGEKVNQQLINIPANANITLSDFEMREDTRILLEDFYRPYNAMLAELVDDRRFLWDY